jgi:RNA polymerase sigma-70 factor (ECF subfamily)
VTASDEQRLLSSLRAGRPEACAELVQVHYKVVYRWLVHLTRDAHWAEDLTQETFAAAWQKLDGFQGNASLATWLHRIAYTKFIDSQRARQRADGVLDRIARPKADSDDPFDAAAADEQAQQLYRALDELPAAERAVLVLHYLQGLSYREMAIVLEEPAGTVKWRTSLALGHLRELLPGEVTEDAVARKSTSGPIA